MPNFPIASPPHEPDLCKLLGISLDDVSTYQDLLDRIRTTWPDFDAYRVTASEAGARLGRLSVARENVASISTLVLGMTPNREGVIRYEVSLDESDSILGIENAYGYKGPHAKQLLLHFLAFATTLVGIAVLVTLVLNLFSQ